GAFEIIFKLHPSEYLRWRSYTALLELSLKPNVTIIDNSDIELYHLIKSSKFVIGVFSTALFEAISLNKTVLVWSLPGHEYMRASIESKRAVLIPTNQSLADII